MGPCVVAAPHRAARLFKPAALGLSGVACCLVRGSARVAAAALLVGTVLWSPSLQAPSRLFCPACRLSTYAGVTLKPTLHLRHEAGAGQPQRRRLDSTACRRRPRLAHVGVRAVATKRITKTEVETLAKAKERKKRARLAKAANVTAAVSPRLTPEGELRQRSRSSLGAKIGGAVRRLFSFLI
mmetsp:Transcript_112348/g.317516  ORF Transcript_112348/g.317516 Transcript_112348/m.317516 type:complete len:183 (+) Transcript_112348:47-595(+)